jgi:Kef-type K+ transport system membrane component KefB
MHLLAAALTVSPDLHEILQIPGEGRKLQIMLVLMQLSALLASAKLLGAAVEKIKVPGVIGELLAGVIIGPFLLGQWIPVPLHGQWVPLFPPPISTVQWPVNEVIWSFAQFASIVLLFLTGLHTDLKQFVRYAGPATLVALAGVVVPVGLGMGVVYIPAFAELARGSPDEPVIVAALFVGVILAATSIGITARVLADIDKLDTPEGVTILGAAVIDDVLGIIALAIVGGIAATGTVSFASVSWISLKAFGVWIAITLLVLLMARPIEKLFTRISYGGTMVALALALAFICSGIAESFGLAFIIGAYSAGLGLSRTRMAEKLMESLQPIADFIVPIFFATLGMLVNFEAMFSNRDVILFGIAVTIVAMFGKIFGCALAAYPVGFNAQGAFRIGVGMMPRGEVALIVAGVGLSQQIIGPNVFGVSIMMTLVTTIVAPIMLVPAFKRGGSGRRVPEVKQPSLPAAGEHVCTECAVPSDLANALVERLLKAAEQAGWEPSYDRAAEDFYLLRNGPDAAQLRLADDRQRLRIDSDPAKQAEFARLLAQAQQSIVQDVQKVQQTR